jgi:hypothetical protein
VGFTPVFLLIVLALVQGVIGISGIDAINKAARDGARAAAVGSSEVAAARHALPDWLGLRSVSGCGGPDVCVKVTGSIPFGVPGLFSWPRIDVSREATMPRVR